jgi:molybdopterin converting factor small subunit
MSVTIKLYGILRIILKEKEQVLAFDNGTLEGLIGEMTGKCGPKVKRELLDDEGRLDHSYSIFINGERATDLDEKIVEGDEVVITSMLAGG